MCPDRKRPPKIDLPSTEQEPWYGQRDVERVYPGFSEVTVAVTTGMGELAVELRDFEGTAMDVDDLESAIRLYRRVESEIAQREMNRGDDQT